MRTFGRGAVAVFASGLAAAPAPPPIGSARNIAASAPMAVLERRRRGTCWEKAIPQVSAVSARLLSPRGESRAERRRSRPVSRILSPRQARGATISLGAALPRPSMQPTREHRTGSPLPAWPCSGWGLPSRPVTRPLVSSYLTVAPLPLPRRRAVVGGWRSFSVALSAGLPAWVLPSILPCGVRTFLDPAVSDRTAAARPAPPPQSIRTGNLFRIPQRSPPVVP